MYYMTGRQLAGIGLINVSIIFLLARIADRPLYMLFDPAYQIVTYATAFVFMFVGLTQATSEVVIK